MLRTTLGLPIQWYKNTPPCPGRYLCYFKHYDEPKILSWEDDKWYFNDVIIIENVLYWSYLPSPPSDVEHFTTITKNMSIREKEIIRMRYVEDMSKKAITKAYNISYTTLQRIEESALRKLLKG